MSIITFISEQFSNAFLKSFNNLAPFEVSKLSFWSKILTLNVLEQVWASAGSGLVNSYPMLISIEDKSLSSVKFNNFIKLFICGPAKSQFLSLVSEKITRWTWAWLKFLVWTDFE